MAKMDPVATTSASSSRRFQDNTPYPPAVASATGAPVNDPRLTSPRTQTATALLHALELAADRTATTIAQGTKQTSLEVRARLSEVVQWVVASLRTSGSDADPCPPVIAREYVSTLKVNLLAELANTSDLNANEVVRALIKLDEAEDAWRRTDRGKFISRLTGADCADAVVAIAHDIRSPLCSILLLVDALRRTEKAAANPIRERQLGLIYGAAFGLSTTVSNLIGAARGEGLVQGKPMPFSVSETMHSVSAIVQPMCEEKGIPLGIEFPDHDARVGHASAIQQALVNLASNALRYTDAGSVGMGCSRRPPRILGRGYRPGHSGRCARAALLWVPSRRRQAALFQRWPGTGYRPHPGRSNGKHPSSRQQLRRDAIFVRAGPSYFTVKAYIATT